MAEPLKPYTLEEAIAETRRLAAENERLRECRAALAYLVALKDGVRDQVYRDTKDGAWERARRALEGEE